ncbi:MAG: hypothetical protein ACFFD2_04180 [Promethearchaeota archaeon]
MGIKGKIKEIIDENHLAYQEITVTMIEFAFILVSLNLSTFRYEESTCF